MVLRREQCTDIALQQAVGLDPALDGFLNLRVGGMHQVPDLLADACCQCANALR